MFSRRTPVKERQYTHQQPNDNNGSKDKVGVPSPSRNESSKSKRKLSLFERSRLWFLRNKGSPIWLLLFVVGAVFCAVQEMNTDAMLPLQLQRSKINTLWYTSDIPSEAGDRVLFQPIELQKEGSRQVIRGKSLFQRANYQPKPLMVGFVLVPDSEKMKANYFLVHHPMAFKLKRMDAPKELKPNQREEFTVVRIDHQDHGKIEYRTPNAKGLDLTWKFDKYKVAELGNGVDKQQDIKENSKDYDRGKPDDPPKDCIPQYDWQVQSFPNCNNLHEVDVLTRLRTLNPAEEPESILLARGGYRDVWMVEQNDLPPSELGETVAMKTLLYEHPWTERNMDRHRRDALATDRLRRSPNALDLFGYCGNTGIYEFADGGSLEDAVDDDPKWKTWTSATKMKYAYQVAKAVADTHNIDKEGVPSMSHTDISMSQFVSTDDGKTYRINDFNRARFLFVDKDDSNKLCKFDVASNKGKFRSPEEYMYQQETAAIDVYSMGNIFFVILTGDYPFAGIEKKEAMKMVIKGQRPEIDEKYTNSDDPLIKTLVDAIHKCWIHDPEKRATSREVEKLLRPFAKDLPEQ